MMNTRQQEPPSSYLQGAGHNTSISRQRINHKKQSGGIRCRFRFEKYRGSSTYIDQGIRQEQVSDSDTLQVGAGASQ